MPTAPGQPPIDDWGFMPHHIPRAFIVEQSGAIDYMYFSSIPEMEQVYTNWMLDVQMGIATNIRTFQPAISLHTLN